jgi:hypothetical protein
MVLKYSQGATNISNIFYSKALKIFPSRDFLFGNLASGNPAAKRDGLEQYFNGYKHAALNISYNMSYEPTI